MTIVLWEGDEELPGSANILFFQLVIAYRSRVLSGVGYYYSYKFIKYYASELGESVSDVLLGLSQIGN